MAPALVPPAPALSRLGRGRWPLPPHPPRRPRPRPPPTARIRALPRAVVQRLAAGEVLAGPSCAVRELVENALDAGARSILVDIRRSARGIAVTDDGRGMARADVARAAACNATSKLRTLSGLRALHTLGFRGQALWALAGVCALRVASRGGANDLGWEATFAGDGRPLREGGVAMAAGTAVSAEGLPWEMRPRALRDVRTWLVHAALCHPSTRFVLRVDGRCAWDTPPAGDVVAAFARLVGRAAADFRRVVVVDDALGEGGCVEVVVGLPHAVHCASSARMIVAVNGRVVDLKHVSARVRAVMRAALPRRRFPAVLVRASVTREDVCNWNVHPMKATMRVGTDENPCDLEGIVERAVREALAESFEGVARLRGGRESFAPLGADAFERLVASSVRPELVVAEERSEGGEVGEGGEEVGGGVSGAVGGRSLFNVQVVAQTLDTYILAEHDGGLFLIEQHVAHERILFERLRDDWTGSFRPLSDGRQLVLPPFFAEDEERLLVLSCLGFEVEWAEVDGAESADDDAGRCQDMLGVATIKAVPDVLRDAPRDELLSILLALSSAAGGASVDGAAASLACRSAVRNGTPLSRKQMEDIVAKLVRCENSQTCPHGRPIMMAMTHKELASVFQRNYVPGSGNVRRQPKRLQGILG